MATDHILTLLIAERDRLQRAIDALGPPRRGPGRPPKAAALGGAIPTRRRRRSSMSAAARKATSERMKRFWEARRKAKAKKA